MTEPTDAARIAAAQAAATIARARLTETLEALKSRVSPQALAHDAAESIKGKGVAIARDVASAATRRPGAVAAVAGGVALLLFRRPLAALVRRASGRPPSPDSDQPKGPAR